MPFRDDDETRKAYYRAYNKRWYQKHKKRLFEKSKRHDSELRQWLQRYKSRLCCQRCGEIHPACLQFHHRDRKRKSYTISQVIGSRRNLSLAKLEEEISKCDILCGNCHALVHWQEAHDFDDWREVLFTIE
jgi:hypothetical protein